MTSFCLQIFIVQKFRNNAWQAAIIWTYRDRRTYRERKREKRKRENRERERIERERKRGKERE
jgi:hypothetical protein